MADQKQPQSYPLRMPEELRKQLEDCAKENNRSMNAEIIARLQASNGPGLISLPWPDLIAMLQREAAQRGATVTITIGQ